MSTKYDSEGSHRVYIMTRNGWEYQSGVNVFCGGQVPRAVHDLYIAEGWTRIVWQRLFVGELVYPLIELEDK